MNIPYNYSIIIPYRDKYDLFVKAVNSIPDREDIQIIIVDNAPQSLLQEQIPIRMLNKVTYITSSPFKGAGCARNVGLKHVQGRYILFLDADDYFTSEAFFAFDKYLKENYNIVFFKPTSIKLSDDSMSNRHLKYCNLIDEYIKKGNGEALRYRWYTPWSKLFNANYVCSNKFLFEEIKVGNDTWFSVITGHFAKTITADESIVYAVTEGENGSSLTQIRTEENYFVRFQMMIRINNFLKSINKYKYHIRLLGCLRIVWNDFGFKSFLKFLKYAIDKRACIF